MNTHIRLRDLTLRDGQQSQFATRMTQSQIDLVLPHFKNAHFYAMEVWGGAVPDSVMRYLNENPWTRLEKIKEGIGSSSKLTALSRGRNLFGYTPYPDSVIQGFCEHSIESGVDIMRIFDALNDLSNIECSLRSVQDAGGIADCAVCYTCDPVFTMKDRFSAFVKGSKIPGKIFTIEYFVKKAKELEDMGADMITIKDMAGLIDPKEARALIRALKNEISIPIDLHTHCTPGFGLASTLMAMVNGVDILDTVLMNFSGGPAAPAYEIIQLFADKLKIDTGVDRSAAGKANMALRSVRAELDKFDQYKRLPPEIDLSTFTLPKEIDALFDKAIDCALSNDPINLTKISQRIEAYFNYPEPDTLVQSAQIPGGMYTNMVAQLKDLKLEHLQDEVLHAVPLVRLDAGIPPLVTPTSQIVGAQAVNCVVDRSKGLPFYTNSSKNFIELVKGSYGKTPYPINPEFRMKIAGTHDETPYDTSAYVPQKNPLVEEAGSVPLAKDAKEVLLLELFPSVADRFLRGVRIAEYKALHGESSMQKADALSASPIHAEEHHKESKYSDTYWEELSLQMEA